LIALVTLAYGCQLINQPVSEEDAPSVTESDLLKASTEPVSSAEWLIGEKDNPSVCVIDLKSETIEKTDIEDLSRKLWSELFTTRKFRMLERPHVKRILESRGVTLEPSYFKYTPLSLAEKLDLECIVIGHVNLVGSDLALDVSIHTRPDGAVVAAQSAQGSSIEDLAVKIPTVIMLLTKEFEAAMAQKTNDEAEAKKSSPEDIMKSEEMKAKISDLKKLLSEREKMIAEMEKKQEELSAKMANYEERETARNRLTDAEKFYLKSLQKEQGSSEHINLLTKAIEKAPDNPKYAIDLARSYSIKGDYDQALNYVNKALEIKPEEIEYLTELSHIQLEREEYQDAIETSKKALKLDPEDPLLMIELAHIYFRNGNYDKTIEHARKAIAKKPDEPNAHIFMGSAYYELEEYQHALDAFQSALNYDKDNFNAQFNLALTMEKFDKEKAIGAWETYIEMAISHPLQREYLEIARKQIEDLKQTP